MEMAARLIRASHLRCVNCTAARAELAPWTRRLLCIMPAAQERSPGNIAAVFPWAHSSRFTGASTARECATAPIST